MSGTNAPVCIGWSALTPLGPSARHTGFYLRAGRSSFAESPFVDTFGDAISLSRVGVLSPQLTGNARLHALASEALAQAIGPLRAAFSGAGTQLCLALPARFASGAADDRLSDEGQRCIAALRSSFPRPGFSDRVHSFAQGVAAGAPALAKAHGILGAFPSDIVVVCGVDSYYDADVLSELERTDRLMTADNLDALRPGEAAACVVLVGSRHPLASARGVFSVQAVGIGVEPTADDPERHTMAIGLSAALRDAVAGLRSGQGRCRWLFSDLTHESRRIRELQIVFARFGDIMREDVALETPAREIGEVGAATLPLFAALAGEAWQRGYGEDEHALCLASERALCGALWLRQMSEGRDRA